MGCSLKRQKGIAIVNVFQKILDNSTRKSNKIWLDKGSEFHICSLEKWLKDNDIEFYSTHNEGKSLVAERFIRTFKNKSYNHIKAVSKSLYIDELYDIVNEYNNTYHRTIKMKPIEAKDNTYIEYIKDVNDKDPNFKVGNHVRISKLENIFAKRYTRNWSEDVFVVKEVKNTVPWTYVINDLYREEIIGRSTKTNQQGFRIEKVIKRKGNKLFVKWKRYDNLFKIWIDENDFLQKWVNTFLNHINHLVEILMLIIM